MMRMMMMNESDDENDEDGENDTGAALFSTVTNKAGTAHVAGGSSRGGIMGNGNGTGKKKSIVQHDTSSDAMTTRMPKGSGDAHLQPQQQQQQQHYDAMMMMMPQHHVQCS
mmetsp:Transcript_1395/g.1525  ORF Transcript_1395/g.1525 Transcript_1395/m.1525 type:complete len:111 (+) Transcript_1395:740-1072(+)